MSNNDQYHGGAHVFSMYGDLFPSERSYSDPANAVELYKMYHRNEFVQIMCDWMVSEAFRNWISFIKDDKPIRGLKFGKAYTFEGYEYVDDGTGLTTTVTPFQEYCQWNDVPVNWKQGVSWSRLYNQGSLLVFLDSDANLLEQTQKAEKAATEIVWKANPNPQGYTRFTVFQPFAVGSGTGFDVEEMNPDNTIKTWKVMMQPEGGKSKTFLIDAERCIHLLWKKRENGWQACSRVLPMLRFCIFEEMTFQKLTKRAHDLAGGILHIDGIASEKEQTDLDASMGTDLTSVDRIYTLAGRTVEYKTPDLKAAGEFSAIFELYTKKLCRFMRVNQLILDGEHTGASLGGNDNAEIMSAYTEIYEIQEHYKNYLEKVFFKLGKENTNFIYREVLPMGLRVQQQMQTEQMEMDQKQTDNKDNQNENKKSGDAAQPPQRADSRNKQPVSPKSKSPGREQTR